MPAAIAWDDQLRPLSVSDRLGRVAFDYRLQAPRRRFSGTPALWSTASPVRTELDIAPESVYMRVSGVDLDEIWPIRFSGCLLKSSHFYGIVVYFNPNDHSPLISTPDTESTGLVWISEPWKLSKEIFPGSSMKILRDWMRGKCEVIQQGWDLARQGVFVTIPPRRR